MNRYIIPPADADAFDAFVELLHAKVPHTGWQSVTQLPPLSPKDYALILRVNPDAFDDIRPVERDVADWLENEGVQAAAACISTSILMQLQCYLREQLLRALQDHEEEQQIADAAEKLDRSGLTRLQFEEIENGVEPR